MPSPKRQTLKQNRSRTTQCRQKQSLTTKKHGFYIADIHYLCKTCVLSFKDKLMYPNDI